MDIKGKKAVVFGGTSGIGLATCQKLQARGADVVAVSRDPNKVGTSIDGVSLSAVDARDSRAVSAFFDKIGRAHVRTPVTSQSRMPSSA